jgi:hypothetical protein
MLQRKLGTSPLKVGGYMKKVLMGERYWYLKAKLDRLAKLQDSGSSPPVLYPQAPPRMQLQADRKGEQGRRTIIGN